ncbi:zinc ABC transporter substrate-binding protein [Candidatus Saccharibacteria bacterium]|nr:zinc ABC transporter substrate-binding protein [Candidatus Saccharibacteria bacterium]
MSRLKIAIAAVVLVAVAAVLLLWPRADYSGGRIISTSFVGYDFARAVAGTDKEMRLLLKPGTDMHSYEPSPQDIIDIQKSQLFIYIGGESEEWVERLLENNEIPAEKTLRLMDFVELKKEEITDDMKGEGFEEEDEYDEHIWTSPKNAMLLVNAIRDKLTSINYDDPTMMDQNAKNYNNHLSQIDEHIREIVEKSEKKVLVFADRFPFRYLVDEYGLHYVAAFPGCAEQTEASSQTISRLISATFGLGVKGVLKIELSSSTLADTVAEAAGVQVYTLHSAHNITMEDYANGITYANIMDANVVVLSEVLN